MGIKLSHRLGPVVLGALFVGGCVSADLAGGDEPMLDAGLADELADAAPEIDPADAAPEPEADAAPEMETADAAPEMETADAAPAPEVDAEPADAGPLPDAPPPVFAPVPASEPAAAIAGDTALVVWADERGDTFDIYGTRVSSSGAALDPAGIPIAVSAGDQRTPAVAFSGDQYLVVWKDDRAGKNAIYAARVSAGGEVLDPEGIAVATGGGSTQLPEVASLGGDFLVVWEGPCGQIDCVHGIQATRVLASGEVAETTRISPPSMPAYTPAIAAAGDHYLVVWADIRSGVHDLYGRFVTAAGAVEGADFAVSAAVGNQVEPALASDGAGFLAVWQDTRTGVFETYAARIAVDGEILDPDGIVVAEGGIWRDGPAVAVTDGAYVAAWSEARDGLIHVRTLQIDPLTGETFAEALVTEEPSAGGSPLFDHKAVALAPFAQGAVVAWQAPWSNATTIYDRAVGAGASEPEARVISTGPSAE